MGAGLHTSILAFPPKRVTRDFLAAYNDSPWLRATVAKIAQGVAHAPWEIFHTEHGRRFPLPVHPPLDPLARGNAYMIGLEVRRLTQIHLELVGEAFEVLERNHYGWPRDILPIPPHFVARRPQPRAKILQYPSPQRLPWRGRGGGCRLVPRPRPAAPL